MTKSAGSEKRNAFFEKVALLLITGALTGILIPYIDGRLSESRFRDQKIFEAELQRQHDVLAAQTELLRNLSKLAWDFALLNINVSFYKINGDDASYAAAVDKYQSKSGDILGQFRTELSVARRLVSPEMHGSLDELYKYELLRIDSTLEQLIVKGDDATGEDWSEQHRTAFSKTQNQIDDVLMQLALELQLTSVSAEPN